MATGNSLTRAEAIAERMRGDVLERRLRPGQKLIETELGERYGASRTPIRAALAALAAEGLLVYRPQQGYQVRGFTLRQISDANRVRARLEAMAAEEAAKTPLSKAEAERLARLLARGDRILAKGRLAEADRSAWQDMNEQFHDFILERSDNRFLADMVRKTRLLPFLSVRNIHWYDLQRDFATVKSSHVLHHRVLDAMNAGDPARAGEAMYRHIDAAIEHLIKRLVDQRLLDDFEI